jgi:hypothetical protein
MLTGLAGLGKTTKSKGEYALALSRIRIPAQAIELLELSKTFRKIRDALNNEYVDHLNWIALQKRTPRLKLDNDFRIVARGNRLHGRRVLYVSRDASGSLFIPGQSVESPTGWDIIRFALWMNDSDVVPWVQAIAHESAHALRRVRSRGPGPSSPAGRAEAAVLDECATRRIEQRIVGQIRATTAGRAAFASHPPPPRVDRCDCERDWFPAGQKRTYLEQFVLGMDWEAAAKSLRTTEVEQINKDVEAIPLLKASSTHKPSILLNIMKGGQIGALVKQFPVLQSPAGQAAFVLRLVDVSWRQLMRKVGETSSAWKSEKERRLALHARLFFKIPASYTKCP